MYTYSYCNCPAVGSCIKEKEQETKNECNRNLSTFRGDLASKFRMKYDDG